MEMINQLSEETLTALQSLADQQGISVADYLAGLVERDKEYKEIIPEKLYSTDEAARKLGLSYNKTLHLCQDRVLEYAKTDSRYKIYGWSMIEYRDRDKVDPKEWIDLEELLSIVNPAIFKPFPPSEKKGNRDYVKREDFANFIKENMAFWNDLAAGMGIINEQAAEINEDEYTDTSKTTNFVEVQGVLKKQPVLKTSTGGTPCCNFGIWRWHFHKGKWNGGYISCFMFGPEAVHFVAECENKFHEAKTLAVLLRGELHPSNFKKGTEETRYNVQIKATDYEFVKERQEVKCNE